VAIALVNVWKVSRENSLDALQQRNPSVAPLADHVAFSENNVSLLLGDGLWGTITGRGPPATELFFADPDKGQVGFFRHC